MSKTGFYKLMAFAIAVVIFAVGYRLLTVTPRTSKSLHQLNQSWQENRGQTTEEADNLLPSTLHNRIAQITQETLATEAPQADKNITTEIDLILDELKPHKYSEDPYIEAHTLAYEIYFCSEQATKDQNNLELPMEAHLKNLYKKAQKECASTRVRYPNLVSLADSFSAIDKISPTTAAGKSIKAFVPDNSIGRQQFKDQINLRLKHVLQSKIGPIIAETGMASFIYFQDGESMPVSQWLHSQETEYNRQVTQLALSKLACRYQAGKACAASSYHMILYCINEKSACGLNFDDYYQQTVMPGMQKDVEILIEKFAAMSEVRS